MVGDIIRGKDCLKEKKGGERERDIFAKTRMTSHFGSILILRFSIDLSTLRALRIGRNTQNLIPYDEID